MTIGVIGRKCGMTRIFTEEGVSIPVTVIEIEPNRVTQFKTEETDALVAVSGSSVLKKAISRLAI